MRAVDLIRKKRDGRSLNAGEIDWLVEGLMNGETTDYQWSALLMAVLWRGMDTAETTALTHAMTRSGEVVDLSAVDGPKVGKHSTGGVGDKTTLILAPIAAAVGVLVPKMSGRGLGHTGGTLDKLESIPGFRVDLDLRRYRQVLEECGLVLTGPTGELAPADKRLYALRDATATVESIPLLASSIMSKKLAEGLDGLVLDVKTGNGAFLERLEDSRTLAEIMCSIGKALGKRMRALITRMDQPLGAAVGNAVEVAECVGCLRGEGPSDLLELSVELAAEMVVMADLTDSLDEARSRCRGAIADGSALERFRGVVAAQGGDPRVVDDPDRLPHARRKVEIRALSPGYVSALAAWPIGQATKLLGAGRARVDSKVDPTVGLILDKKVGDLVEDGDRLCTVYVNDESRLDTALEMIYSAFTLGDSPPSIPSLIVERI